MANSTFDLARCPPCVVNGIEEEKEKAEDFQMEFLVRNPFEFKLTKAPTYDYETLSGTLKTDVRCSVIACFGLPRSSLIEILERSFPVDFDTTLKNSARGYYPLKDLMANEERNMEFPQPEDIMPISYYFEVHLKQIFPFVLLVQSLELQESDYYPNPSVAFSAYVMYPKEFLDEDVLMANYVRLSTNQVAEVQKIYYLPPGEDMCVTCLEKKASMVQLGCRHCCVCPCCYNRFFKCPLCRNRVRDFFVVPEV